MRGRKSKNVELKGILDRDRDFDKKRFRAIEIYAWVQSKSGVPQTEIAKIIRRSTKQVSRFLEKIDTVMRGKFDTEASRELCFVANIYQAIDNVGWLLANRDSAMTINFLRGMGVFKDYVHNEVGNSKLTKEGLEKRYLELSEDLGVGKSNGATPGNRISKIAFSEDSPQHEGGAA